MKKYLFATTSLLLILSFCGCGAEPVPESTASVAISVSTPAPAPSLTADATPSPIVALNEFGMTLEEIATINQRIHDFINREGDYSNEALASSGNVFTDADGNPMDFGWYRDDETTAAGWLFGSFEEDGNQWLIIGFDGKDGERFVTVLEHPTKFYLELGLSLYATRCDDMGFFSTCEDRSDLITHEAISDFLQSIENSPVRLSFYADVVSDSEMSKYADQRHYVEDLNLRVGLVNEVFAELARNGIANIDAEQGLHPDTIEDGTQLVRIESLDDITGLTSNEIPFFFAIVYAG